MATEAPEGKRPRVYWFRVTAHYFGFLGQMWFWPTRLAGWVLLIVWIAGMPVCFVLAELARRFHVEMPVAIGILVYLLGGFLWIAEKTDDQTGT